MEPLSATSRWSRHSQVFFLRSGSLCVTEAQVINRSLLAEEVDDVERAPAIMLAGVEPCERRFHAQNTAALRSISASYLIERKRFVNRSIVAAILLHICKPIHSATPLGHTMLSHANAYVEGGGRNSVACELPFRVLGDRPEGLATRSRYREPHNRG